MRDFPNKYEFSGCNGDFVFRSGKIVRHWNNWYGLWVHWYVIEALCKVRRGFAMNHMNFRLAMNRGRHFDRKFKL